MIKMNITTSSCIIPKSKLFSCRLEELKKEERVLREAKMREEVEMNEEQSVVERVYTADFDGLFAFYITKHE